MDIQYTDCIYTIALTSLVSTAVLTAQVSTDALGNTSVTCHFIILYCQLYVHRSWLLHYNIRDLTSNCEVGVGFNKAGPQTQITTPEYWLWYRVIKILLHQKNYLLEYEKKKKSCSSTILHDDLHKVVSESALLSTSQHKWWLTSRRDKGLTYPQLLVTKCMGLLYLYLLQETS